MLFALFVLLLLLTSNTYGGVPLPEGPRDLGCPARPLAAVRLLPAQ